MVTTKLQRPKGFLGLSDTSRYPLTMFAQKQVSPLGTPRGVTQRMIVGQTGKEIPPLPKAMPQLTGLHGVGLLRPRASTTEMANEAEQADQALPNTAHLAAAKLADQHQGPQLGLNPGFGCQQWCLGPGG